jgi:molybdopterin-binding protein
MENTEENDQPVAVHGSIWLTMAGKNFGGSTRLTPRGEQLVAIVTHESRDSLDLALGSEAFALVKASSIVIVTDDHGAKFSARNRLVGKTATAIFKASSVIVGVPA